MVEEEDEGGVRRRECGECGTYFVLDCEHTIRIEVSGVQISEDMSKGTKIVEQSQGLPVKKSRSEIRDGEGHSV